MNFSTPPSPPTFLTSLLGEDFMGWNFLEDQLHVVGEKSKPECHVVEVASIARLVFKSGVGIFLLG